MTNGWRPKSVRNNKWTTAYDRARLAQQDIFLGAYANRTGDNPTSTPMSMSATTPPRPTSRFAQSSQPPTKAQLEAYNNAQRPQERWNGGYQPNGVKGELMGFRDAWISDRHRGWGKDAPMLDIDYLVVEYDHSRPRALIEYKCAIRDNGTLTPPPDFTTANYKTLVNMANMMTVPLLAVYYNRENVTFTVYPANGWAEKLCNGRTPRYFTEEEWVERIYALSVRTLPDDLRNRLSKTK